MKNGIRKILEFIKKIMPLIIIIAIFLAIKFNPKWLTDFLGITNEQDGVSNFITDFLGITNKQEDVSNLISYIELFIECCFLYFALKEIETTRKSFEWQEKAEIERRLKVICCYIYDSFSGQRNKLLTEQGELKQTEFTNFIVSLKEKYLIPMQLTIKVCNISGETLTRQTYLNIMLSLLNMLSMKYCISFFASKEKKAHKKINECYSKIISTLMDVSDDWVLKQRFGVDRYDQNYQSKL